MVAYGDDQPILCSHSMEQAFDLAEDFAKGLHQRIKAGGFNFNMRYDKGAEMKLFETLSGRIQEITKIFGSIPDFIVDQWVTDMFNDKEWDANTVLTVIAERQRNPFTVKETVESLDADWDNTAEVLNQAEAMRLLLDRW